MSLFQFEQDFAQTLRCIPISVRLKLDTVGIKLKLQQWIQFPATARQQLLDTPCQTPPQIQHYQATLTQMIQTHCGQDPQLIPVDPHPPWQDLDRIPESVLAQAQAKGIQVSDWGGLWGSLTPLQRFALIKLSRSQHENRNFLPALQQFAPLYLVSSELEAAADGK